MNDFRRVCELAIVVLVFSALGACGSRPESGSPVRATVHEVYRGQRWERADCSAQHYENCCDKPDLFSYSCVGFEKPTVASVRVFGKDVAVLLINQGSLILAVSRDLGDTWHSTPIEVSNITKAGEVFTGPVDVVLRGEKAWLYISRLDTPAKGAKIPYTYQYPVDLSTGKLDTSGDDKFDPKARLIGEAPLGMEDGKLLHLHVQSTSNPDRVYLTETRVDPEHWQQHDTWQSQQLECTHPGCRHFSALTVLGSDDGDHFAALMRPVDGVHEQCVVTYGRAKQTLDYRCVPMYAWPAPRADDFVTAPYAGERAAELQGYSVDGHAWAVAVPPTALDNQASPVALKPAYLGPGRVAWSKGWNSRTRFADLFLVEPNTDNAVQSSLQTQLVEVQRSGVARVVSLPRSPCEEEGTCGDREATKQERYGQTAWIERLEDGEYLQIYAYDEAPALSVHQTVILATRSRAAYGTVPAPPEPTAPAKTLPGHPRIEPASPLDARLLLIAACGKSLPWSDDELSMVRLSTPANRAWSQALYDAIMAIPLDQGCGFELPDPSGCGVPCGPGGSCSVIPNSGGNKGCQYAAGLESCNTCTADNLAVVCDSKYGSLRVASVLDCAKVGQACGCTKAADGSCATAPQCVAPECAGSTASCDGAVSSTCSDLRYCDRVGGSCTTDGRKGSSWSGCAWQYPPDEDSSCDGLASLHPAYCEGPYLFQCSKPSMRYTYVDCAALGFSTCGQPVDPYVRTCLP